MYEDIGIHGNKWTWEKEGIKIEGTTGGAAVKEKIASMHPI